MELPATFSVGARRVGIVSALGVAVLCPVYATALVAGLLSLQTPQDPIGDPFFSVLEILILLLAPLMVVLAAAMHGFRRVEGLRATLARLHEPARGHHLQRPLRNPHR